MVQITYQKNDGCIFHRYRKTDVPYKIGETTSMGWKVLNIEYEYKNKYYPEYEYNKLKYKDKQVFIKKKETIESLKVEFKNFLYCFLAILLINFFKILMGM